MPSMRVSFLLLMCVISLNYLIHGLCLNSVFGDSVHINSLIANLSSLVLLTFTLNGCSIFPLGLFSFPVFLSFF